ncbi:hypothetical protein [Burkholderia sp. MSHR3999]|uniref:hypothetical protein n=1 Tax=Burkholderia sp. MSHR3999 TaxID=1542965 RepID=UPI000B03A99F|nr:hypothetical protein [Burkholderia sp. MSHR3999]
MQTGSVTVNGNARSETAGQNAAIGATGQGAVTLAAQGSSITGQGNVASRTALQID